MTSQEKNYSHKSRLRVPAWVWSLSVVCFLWLGNGSVLAQSSQRDSLLHVLATHSQDTHRVLALTGYASLVVDTLPETAATYLDSAIALATRIDDRPHLAHARWAMAEAQFKFGATETTMEHAIAGYYLYEQLHDWAGMAKCLNTMGMVQYRIQQPEKGIALFNRVRQIARVTGNRISEVKAVINTASCMNLQGDIAGFKTTLMSTLTLMQGLEADPQYASMMGMIYNNLANSFDMYEETDSSLKYYYMALDYKKQQPTQSSYGGTWSNIALMHQVRGEFKEAEHAIEMAIPIVQGANDMVRLTEALYIKAEVCYETRRFAESAILFKRIIAINDSLFGPEMNAQAAKLEATFRSENQRKEIELLSQAQALEEAKNVKLRGLILGIAVVLLLSITVLFLVVKRGRERKRILNLVKRKNEEIERQQQEIMRQNETLQDKNQGLARLNNEKDGLIGIVAHDIRAPLNRTLALVDLLAENGEINLAQAKIIAMIRKTADDGGKLIQDLLELNEIEQQSHAIDAMPHDLAHVLEHVLPTYRVAAEKKSIALTWAPAPAPVSTDEKLLCRILDNLISNAVKFTPKGKAVHLSIESDTARFWIVIHDEGPGINEADQKRMFQKFQRLSARPTAGESSTGLGLSIVRALADRIGAELVFESVVGVGTTFKIGIVKAG